MKTKEVILSFIAVVLIAVVGIGFYVDNNERLLNRTIGIEISDKMEIIDMDKRGFLLYRSSYAAKIKIDYETDPDVFLQAFIDTYEVNGEIFPYNQFIQLKNDVLSSESVVPNPIPDTNVYVLGIEDNNGVDVVYIIDTESSNEAYLYVYYSR